VSGDSDESESKRKETASDASGGVGALCARDFKGVGSQYVDEGKLIVEKEPSAVCYCLQGAGTTSQNSKGMGWKEGTSYTLNTTDIHGVIALDRASYNDEKSIPYTLKIRSGCEGSGKGALIQEDKSATLSTLQDQTLFQPIDAVDCRNGTESDFVGTLQSGMHRSLNCNNVVRTRYIVRRLTPLECERLQGYPDGWTDIGDWTDSKGKVHKSSDASRYKALGNSIALPPWKWVLKRICACYERDATMASLFDGIGGFPYLWEQLNGKGTCLWASEIEEFPMAVTKVRIG
jgi:DNA (cytosine-5)-methyltransferase 1